MEKWRGTLAAGDPAKAWDEFIERYGALISSVIRRTLADDADVPDVYSEVCGALASDDMALPAQHNDTGRARFSTWLVTVVHHKAIDWVRHRDGRPRPTIPAELSGLQREIFQSVVTERLSYVEAYELSSQRHELKLPFATFMKEVAGTFQTLERTTGKSVAHFLPGAPPAIEQPEQDPEETVLSSESSAALYAALEKLPSDQRLAVQLFVVDEVSAADVARIVGWPNAKTVYNRVYRALETLRAELERSAE